MAKRAELREAGRALQKCNFGGAFTPAGSAIKCALDEIEWAIDQCSQKNWGK